MKKNLLRCRRCLLAATARTKKLFADYVKLSCVNKVSLSKNLHTSPGTVLHVLRLHVFEGLVNIGFWLKLLVVDEVLESLALEEALGDRETSFHRVRSRIVGNVVKRHNVELLAEVQDRLCFVAAHVVHEDSKLSLAIASTKFTKKVFEKVLID